MLYDFHVNKNKISEAPNSWLCYLMTVTTKPGFPYTSPKALLRKITSCLYHITSVYPQQTFWYFKGIVNMGSGSSFFSFSNVDLAQVTVW